MPRRALIVGINTYQSPGSNLAGAVRDAEAISKRLERHEDGTPNYECRVLLDRMEDGSPISRVRFLEACVDLFCPPFTGDTLLYFSGHGALSDFGGYLCTADAARGDPGVSMDEVLTRATFSKSSDVVMILDCCFSGGLGNLAILSPEGKPLLALLQENTTIIAASRTSEPAMEMAGHGIFTSAVLDALDGGASDHLGWVTAPSIYAYVERRFGAWEQRPVYKAHTTAVVPIRHCAPLIERLKLRQLVQLFPHGEFEYHLDPEYEPEDEHGNLPERIDQSKVGIARLLKEYRDAGLLKPTTPGEQLFWTARRSHTVKLTPRGREYLWLVQNGKI